MHVNVDVVLGGKDGARNTIVMGLIPEKLFSFNRARAAWVKSYSLVVSRSGQWSMGQIVTGSCAKRIVGQWFSESWVMSHWGRG